MLTQAILGWVKWRGRIRRRSFLWNTLAAATVFIVLYVFIEHAIGRDSTLLLYPPLFAVLLSMAVRRLHDQARSARWLLALLVPVLGPLLIAWLLLFTRGTSGENQYGDDPRMIGRDYLQVAALERA